MTGDLDLDQLDQLVDDARVERDRIALDLVRRTGCRYSTSPELRAARHALDLALRRRRKYLDSVRT